MTPSIPASDRKSTITSITGGDIETAQAFMARPSPEGVVAIALGGASGAGKTTVVSCLKQRRPDQIITYPAFTTRPRRSSEIDGVHYYFRSDVDLKAARLDSRYSGFVEARGYWYWTDSHRLDESIRQYPNAAHLFLISQVRDYVERKARFPRLQWVWLDVNEDELRRRLLLSSERDLEASTRYNQSLMDQNRSGLIDLTVDNNHGRLAQVVNEIAEFISVLLPSRSSQ